MKEIKVGDVYFENEILKVTYTNGYYPGHFMYEMDFLGDIGRYSCNKQSIDETIKKRIAAYNLIPIGCKVIPGHLIGMFKGLLVGGIMEDSIIRVHGICENGIRGFSCSVFFIPSKEYLDSIMDYDSFNGELIIKRENIE
jgi:hypothetical protein